MRGPTPPVIGVIALRSLRSRISLARSPFKTPSSEAVPASTIQAPGLTKESLIKPGTPVAVIMMS